MVASTNKETDMQNWKPEEGKPALLRGSYAPVVVKAIDDKSDRAAIQEHDGDIWIVGIESLAPPMTEEDEAVREMSKATGYPDCIATKDVCRKLYAAGYRKHPTEDMTDPANWRAGDVVRCTKAASHLYTTGHVYEIVDDEKNRPIILDNDRNGTGTRPTATASYFRFHSRP
jgi:hypothetical protein